MEKVLGKPVHLMSKEKLVSEFNRRQVHVSVHFASHRHKGRRIAWWYEYWVRFPTQPHIRQIYEKDKRFRNHTQALRHALGATRWALYCDWKNNSS